LAGWLGLRDPSDWLLYFVALYAYWTFAESSKWQGTVGKRAFGLVVADYQWRRISAQRALVRNVAKWLSGVLFIGYLMAAFTRKKQALHDKVAGCLVLRERTVRERTASVRAAEGRST
jgi:uncharacterized RDD family membrane protein YckC